MTCEPNNVVYKCYSQGDFEFELVSSHDPLKSDHGIIFWAIISSGELKGKINVSQIKLEFRGIVRAINGLDSYHPQYLVNKYQYWVDIRWNSDIGTCSTSLKFPVLGSNILWWTSFRY